MGSIINVGVTQIELKEKIKDCPAKNPPSGRKLFTGQSNAAYRHDKQMMDICREDACYDTAEYSGTAL